MTSDFFRGVLHISQSRLRLTTGPDNFTTIRKIAAPVFSELIESQVTLFQLEFELLEYLLLNLL